MLSIARSALRPALARSYALRSAAALHTLPELPYPYNVCSRNRSANYLLTYHTGSRTSHLRGNHEITSLKAPPDIRQWIKRSGGVLCEIGLYEGENRSPGCPEV
jgi:Fe-Mn family superoxide dismutase